MSKSHSSRRLDDRRTDNIFQSDISVIRSSSNAKYTVAGSITLHLSIDESRTQVAFGVIDKFAVPVLLGTTTIDRAVQSSYEARRNVIPYHSLPLPTLMVHEARSIAEKGEYWNIRPLNIEGLAFLVTTIESESRSIVVIRQVFLKAIFETSELVSTQASGLIKVISHDNVSRKHSFMMAKGAIDVYPGLL